MSEFNLSYAGLVLVLGATAIWSYRAFKVDLPSNLMPFGLAWGICLALGAMALLQGTENGGAAITAVALGGTLLFFLSTGKQLNGSNAIKVGDRLPDFTAPDENGEPFDTNSLAGSAVVLKIFRGHW